MTIDTGYLAPLVDGHPSPEFTLRLSARAFGVTAPAARSRDRRLGRYRTVAMAAMRAVAGQSFRAIGDTFGGRDHSSIMAASQRCRQDPILREALDSLAYEIRRQWAVDHGLPLPPNPNQLTFTAPVCEDGHEV